MNVNSSCPCCSESMLLHLSKRRSYWLCSHCRLEIPSSESSQVLNKSSTITLSSSPLTAAIAPLKSGQPIAAI